MSTPRHNTTLCAYFDACDRRAVLVQTQNRTNALDRQIEKAEEDCRVTLAAYDAAQDEMRKIDAWEEANAIG